MNRSILLLFVCLSIVLVSCRNQTATSSFKNFHIDFFKGFNVEGDTLNIEASTDDVLQRGIFFPSDKSTKYFQVKADFEFDSEKETELFYKIYYQNVSYKFHEANADGSYNLRASENFYGSWTDPSIGFKSLGMVKAQEKVAIIDSIRIAGNPRNELKFYGPANKAVVTKAVIDNSMQKIKSNDDWNNSVKEKAIKNNIKYEEQLYLDALWEVDYSANLVGDLYFNRDSLAQVLREGVLTNPEWKKSIEEKAASFNITFNEQLEKDVAWQMTKKYNLPELINNRYKRNPRLGNYQFMIVILTQEELNQIPEAVIDISKTDNLHNNFLNPFYYFKQDFIKEKVKSIFVNESKQIINGSINLTGEKGIYINLLNIRNPNSSREYYSETVGDSKSLHEAALFEQYFHVINKDYKLKNIPISYDVVAAEYSQEEYNSNKNKYPLEHREISHTQITNAPGKTVYYNDSLDAIQLVNPGFKGNSTKENVGVMTRVGTSYGKYTAKIKFPKMINLENVWNGVTCAFWLFSEDMAEWNKRDLCIKEGYLPKGAKKFSTVRNEYSTYSEIDIEIVKTSKHWPKSSYGGVEDYPIGDPENDHNLMITTTNWDLSCPEPKDFNQGIKEVNYADKNFQLHRWDFWYQALTCKHEYPHDKTVGDEFYYQIEWKPEEIIWRIGKSKDDLDVIGYMNSDNTKIPNNQMIAIVTQEFHYSLWWLLAPFDQNNVPYPGEDINGYVYSIEIE